MTFQLLRFRPDPTALATWASRYRLMSPDGDHGYALHALLTAVFGSNAPKPFRYLGGQRGLLAYADCTADDLQACVGLAEPEVARALGLDTLEIRQFPVCWRVGQRLRFEVRVRPVVRTKDGRERDAFLHAIEDSTREVHVQRGGVYREWLSRQMEANHAAEILSADLQHFRLTRVLRRPPSAEKGRRLAKAVSGPDALLAGELAVADSDAFARLVARGLGRHRAFGFGMLLLKPSS